MTGRQHYGPLRRLAGPVLVGLLLLAGAEGVLRLLGFRAAVSSGGDPKANLLPLFTPVTAADGTPMLRRGTEPVAFRRDKPANGFRVFVVGESSVWGYPYGPALAFSRHLEDLLAAAWPERVVEVVNAGVPAIGSWHVRRIVEDEVVRYAPDVVVIYTGHNDWILPAPDAVSPFATALARLRLYQLAAVTSAAWRRWQFGPVDARRLQARDDPWGHARDRARGTATLGTGERARIAERFAANVRAMIAAARGAGARVLVATLGQNLRDFPPGASRRHRGLPAEARARWEEAVAAAERLVAAGDDRGALHAFDVARRIDAEPARLHYARARALDRLARYDDARQAYRVASDRDNVPLGAPSAQNAALAALAAETAVELVDVDAALHRASPHGLVGDALFCDHLHPSVAGHVVIARALAAALGVSTAPDVPDVDALLAAHPDVPKQEALANIVLALMLGWYDAAEAQVARMQRLDPDFGFTAKDVAYLRAQDDAPPADLLEAAE